MSDFPSVAHSSIYCVDGWIIQGFLIIVHGQRPWTTSLSSIHGQRPWTTLLSSKGDLVSYNSHSRSVTFPSLLGWFLIQFALLDMDDPYGWIGDELIFRYPISCPFRSKGRPGYWHNLELIVSQVSQTHWLTFCAHLVFPKEVPRIHFWVVRVISHTVASIAFSDNIATCHSLSGWRRFVVPTSGPYI